MMNMNFFRIKSDLERVDYVWMSVNSGVSLDRLRRLPKRAAKNDAQSEVFRKEGNDVYKQCHYQEALRLYTKSMSMANPDSLELQLAFGNRSAALFELKLYEECLADIQLVITKKCSKELLEKLLERKKKALQLLPTQRKTPFYMDLPSIGEKDRNPTIQSASNAITINQNSQFGRHIIAQRDIKVGEILIVEKPITQVLTGKFAPFFFEPFCSECGEPRYNLIPCDSCFIVLYCNESCKKTAFARYHQYECPIAASLIGFGATIALCARIAFVTRDEWNNADLDAYGSSTLTELFRSDRYKELHGLVTHDSHLSDEKIYEHSISAAFIFWLVQNETNFLQNYDASKLKRVIYRLLQIMPCNALSNQQLSANRRELESVTFGIYPVCALLNHSCSPNIASYCCGNTQILYSIARIKKDEQCFINYKFEHVDFPRNIRQQQLSRSFVFECTCIACTDDWPLEKDFPSLPSIPFFDQNITQLAVTARNPILMKEVKLKLIQFLEKWGKFMPSMNVLLARRQLIACFNNFGNVKQSLQE